MRLRLALFSLLCLASVANAQGLRFDAGLTPQDHAAVTEAIKYQTSFKPGTMSIAKTQLNKDQRSDYIILSAKPAQCAQHGCVARILLSNGKTSYRHAQLDAVKTIRVGEKCDDVCALIVNGSEREWNGKSFG